MLYKGVVRGVGVYLVRVGECFQCEYDGISTTEGFWIFRRKFSFGNFEGI